MSSIYACQSTSRSKAAWLCQGVYQAPKMLYQCAAAFIANRFFIAQTGGYIRREASVLKDKAIVQIKKCITHHVAKEFFPLRSQKHQERLKEEEKDCEKFWNTPPGMCYRVKYENPIRDAFNPPKYDTYSVCENDNGEKVMIKYGVITSKTSSQNGYHAVFFLGGRFTLTNAIPYIYPYLNAFFTETGGEDRFRGYFTLISHIEISKEGKPYTPVSLSALGRIMIQTLAKLEEDYGPTDLAVGYSKEGGALLATVLDKSKILDVPPYIHFDRTCNYQPNAISTLISWPLGIFADWTVTLDQVIARCSSKFDVKISIVNGKRDSRIPTRRALCHSKVISDLPNVKTFECEVEGPLASTENPHDVSPDRLYSTKLRDMPKEGESIVHSLVEQSLWGL